MWQRIDSTIVISYVLLPMCLLNKISYGITWQNNSDQKAIVLTYCNRALARISYHTWSLHDNNGE